VCLDMFKFQDVFSAPTNSIIEFVLDYENIPSAEAQSIILCDYVLKTLSQNNKKVAITYSANNKQAKKIYAAYEHGNVFTGCISGKNQAASMSVLVSSVPEDLRLRFRVLPFATILQGGSDESVGNAMVVRDLTNLLRHLEEGWSVVVLTNPMKLRSIGRYQIGGGKAVHFYDATKRCIPFEDNLLSQGGFVERVLTLLQKASSENLARIRSVLKPFQDTLLDKSTFSTLCLEEPQTLASLVKSKLAKQNLLPEAGDGIEDVVFSPSYNLRVCCSSEKVLKALQKPLAKFKGEALGEARTLQFSKTQGKKMEHLILSIPTDQVVPFLLAYCGIPAVSIGVALSQKMKVTMKADCVVITPYFVVLEDKKCISLEKGPLGEEIFGKRYLKRGVAINPSNVEQILKMLMHQWRNESNGWSGMLKKGSAFRHTPWLVISDANLDADWAEVQKRYNAFTVSICSVFEKGCLDQILAGESEFRVSMGQNFDRVISDVQSCIFSDISRFCFEYWMFFQIAVLSFFRGNFCLCCGVLYAIWGTKELRDLGKLVLCSGDVCAMEAVYESLFQKGDSFGQFDFRALVMLPLYYSRFFGPSLLNTSGFTKWMIEGESKGKGAKEKMRAVIERHLEPVVRDVTLSCKSCPPFERGAERPPLKQPLRQCIVSAVEAAKGSESLMENLGERSLWLLLTRRVKKARALLQFETRSDMDDNSIFISCLKLRGRVLCEGSSSNPMVELKSHRGEIDFFMRFAFFESAWLENSDYPGVFLEQQRFYEEDLTDMDEFEW
jgi:hypothetical protein